LELLKEEKPVGELSSEHGKETWVPPVKPGHVTSLRPLLVNWQNNLLKVL
jgi:hypothetical protein